MPPRKIKTTKKTVKKDTSVQLTTIPLHSWIMFWALVLATMALATVCFTAAFRPAVEPAVDDEALAMFQAVRESLEQQVAELEGKVVKQEKPNNASSDSMSGDFPFECYTENPGPSETYFTYLDQNSYVRMTLPYSFSWGSLDCPPIELLLSPEENYQEIRFGPSMRIEGEGVARDARLSIGDATTTAAVRAHAENELSQDYVSDPSPIRQRTINGIPVISYGYYALGQANIWIAVGRTHTYWLVSGGWLTDAEAVKIIQSLRVTQ
jgi:hypothetical protein